MNKDQKIEELDLRIRLLDRRVDRITSRGFVSVEDELHREYLVNKLMDERDELFRQKLELEQG